MTAQEHLEAAQRVLERAMVEYEAGNEDKARILGDFARTHAILADIVPLVQREREDAEYTVGDFVRNTFNQGD